MLQRQCNSSRTFTNINNLKVATNMTSAILDFDKHISTFENIKNGYFNFICKILTLYVHLTSSPEIWLFIQDGTGTGSLLFHLN